MITANNLIDRFRQFAEAHYFIRTFSFGDPSEIDIAKLPNPPLMHTTYLGSRYAPGLKVYSVEVYILDQPPITTSKQEYQQETVSDAEQCAEDILADMEAGHNVFDFEFTVENASATPLRENASGLFAGVLLELEVGVPYNNEACFAPLDGVQPGTDEQVYQRRGLLKVTTIDGAVDVPSVNTIRVTNGTLTNNGSGVVTLDTGTGGGIQSTDDLTEGQTNLYYTDARVASSASVSANTTKLNTIEEGAEVNPVSTDQLPEGDRSDRLYFTEGERNLLTLASADIVANRNAILLNDGNISINALGISGVDAKLNALSPVAATGNYADLSNQPTTDDLTEGFNKFVTQADKDKLAGLTNPVNVDWTIAEPTDLRFIKNKPTVYNSFVSLPDTPSTLLPGLFLGVNDAGTAIELKQAFGEVSSVTAEAPLRDTYSASNSIVELVIDEATTSLKGAMSASDKAKLDGIEAGAEVNVQSDWNATSGDKFIVNKPVIPQKAEDLTDVPTIGTAGQVLSVNSNGDKLEYRTIGSAAQPQVGVAFRGENAAQQLVTATPTRIRFENTYYDQEGIIDLVASTITTGLGYYLVTADIVVYNPGVTSGSRSEVEVRMLYNGIPIDGFKRRIYARDAPGGQGGSASFSFPVYNPTNANVFSWDIARVGGATTATELYHCQFSYMKMYSF